MKKFFNVKKGDAAVIAVLAALAALTLLLRPSGKNVTASVSVDGETVFETDLSGVPEKSEIELGNGVVLGIEPGKIYFVSSPCPGKDCVKYGELTKAGQTAVCVPTKTVITLSGKADKNAPDAISY